MEEYPTPPAAERKFPEPPAWIKEFEQRTLLIKVIKMAFDPNVSDKEVRDKLIEAAQGLKELGLPPTPSA